ncbi:MAG TPA: hypothetical protein VJ904_12985, partial [Tichowtungia sp.]|nr:hypothetical protein [Tichowtungia sp.]
MLPQWVIEKKRDGTELPEKEIRFLIEEFTAGTVPDCQMAAFAMAVFFRGMTTAETVALTSAMMHSGETIEPSALPGIKADKHS